jgi:NAD(P)H-hydrate epimerase
MQAIDRAAIDRHGIPRVLLMDHAAAAVARAVCTLRSPVRKPVVIYCGSGYNGGDGLAAARHLVQAGRTVRIVLAGRLNRLREEPALFLRMARALRIPVLQVTRARHVRTSRRLVQRAGVIVDALLGIGARGPAREPVHSLIRQINAAGLPVVSADVPSGLDADSGQPYDEAVRATMTVTFGSIKRGCLTAQGRRHCGRLIVDRITIPPRLLGRVPR